jgi:hypothetical protein
MGLKQQKITNVRVRHPLMVALGALVALAGGGYAVETVNARS